MFEGRPGAAVTGRNAFPADTTAQTVILVRILMHSFELFDFLYQIRFNMKRPA
jgi:hypothetical protein